MLKHKHNKDDTPQGGGDNVELNTVRSPRHVEVNIDDSDTHQDPDFWWDESYQNESLNIAETPSNASGFSRMTTRNNRNRSNAYPI